jgi:hypothetical protein
MCWISCYAGKGVSEYNTDMHQSEMKDKYVVDEWLRCFITWNDPLGWMTWSSSGTRYSNLESKQLCYVILALSITLPVV